MTRDEAIQALKDISWQMGSVKRWENIEAIDMAISALSAEAVQGEWQRVDEQPYFRKHYHKVCCSVCHKQGSEKYNFCPNCGARMFREESEVE